MTPEKQRIAIAEVCPSVAFVKPDGLHYWKSRMEPCYDSDKFTHCEFDPLNDLNAMHEAEKVLTPTQRRAHGQLLQEIVGECVVGYVEDYHRQLAGLSRVASATPAQRAEAFLRAVGKWEEGA